MQITIIGAGNMGRGIATRALAGGHAVRIIDNHADKAAQLAADLVEQASGDAEPADGTAIATSDFVVLALKYPASRQAATEHSVELAGKIVIDIANPADLATWDPTTESGTSAAEELAAQLPDARVVKAFNTTFAATLVAGQVNGRPLDVLIAGDDTDAKDTTAQLVQSAGLHPIDVGPLRRARALEAFMILHISLQQNMPNPWHSAIAILT